MYIDKLDDIVNEYNNTYHRTIKMKPIDVKDNTYINIDEEVNEVKRYRSKEEEKEAVGPNFLWVSGGIW